MMQHPVQPYKGLSPRTAVVKAACTCYIGKKKFGIFFKKNMWQDGLIMCSKEVQNVAIYYLSPK